LLLCSMFDVVQHVRWCVILGEALHCAVGLGVPLQSYTSLRRAA
jgi:hypothetical protein